MDVAAVQLQLGLTGTAACTAAAATAALTAQALALFGCRMSDEVALEAVEVLGLYDALKVEAVFAVLLQLDAAALPHGGGEAQLVVGQQDADGVDAVAEGLVQLLQQLIDADVMVSSFMREKGSLESLFMQITGHEEERAVLKHEMESGI